MGILMAAFMDCHLYSSRVICTKTVYNSILHKNSRVWIWRGSGNVTHTASVVVTCSLYMCTGKVSSGNLAWDQSSCERAVHWRFSRWRIVSLLLLTVCSTIFEPAETGGARIGSCQWAVGHRALQRRSVDGDRKSRYTILGEQGDHRCNELC
jgi:hypothetical protein